MIDVVKFKPKTVYVTYIASTPEKIWQALTDATFTKQYFFGFAIEIEPKNGGTFRMLGPDGGTHVSGVVVEWSPPRRLAYSGRSKACRDLTSCRNAWSVTTSSGPRRP